jgi:hypothetical protein
MSVGIYNDPGLDCIASASVGEQELRMPEPEPGLEWKVLRLEWGFP